MPQDILGGGLFFALAAILWLLYLMPNWAKRREYLATERNALRLQQTLRVMAETSEVPSEVSYAINSRSVNQQHKMLLEQEKIQQAQARARRAASARQVKAELREVHAMSSNQKIRIRRTRLVSTVFLVLSLVAAAISISWLFAGVSSLAWLLGISLATAIGSLMILRQLAVVSRTLQSEHRHFQRETKIQLVEETRQTINTLPLAPLQQNNSWVPNELPKPLYLSRTVAAPIAARSAVNAQQVARQRAELIAASEASIDRVRQVEAALPALALRNMGIVAESEETISADAGSRFSRMGVIDQLQIARPNFDEALRRRRSVG